MKQNQQIPIRESSLHTPGTPSVYSGRNTYATNLITSEIKVCFLKRSRHTKPYFYICLIEKEVFSLKSCISFLRHFYCMRPLVIEKSYFF